MNVGPGRPSLTESSTGHLVSPYQCREGRNKPGMRPHDRGMPRSETFCCSAQYELTLEMGFDTRELERLPI